MRDVDDQHVDTGADQLGRALEIVAGGADRRADHQAALRIPGGERAPPLPDEVLRRHQPGQHAGGIDHRQLLDLALHHHLLRDFRGDIALMHDQPIDRRHPVGHRRLPRVDEPEIALGQQSEQPAAIVDDHQGADPRSRHQRPRLGQRGTWRDAVGIADDPVLRALDLLHFAHLRIDLARPVAAVDDADAAFFSLHHRHRRPRHRIHVGGDHRPPQHDAAGQLTGQIDDVGIAARQHAVLRRQDEVVERAAAHQLEHHRAVPGIDRRKGSHAAMVGDRCAPGATRNAAPESGTQ